MRLLDCIGSIGRKKARGRCFWEQESITFAECVAYRTKDEPDERKARVQASFNSTINEDFAARFWSAHCHVPGAQQTS